MTGVERIKALVEQGVREQLLPVLLESAAKRHTRVQKAWRECDCEWCVLKRDATYRIASQFNRPADMRAHYRRMELYEYRAARQGML